MKKKIFIISILLLSITFILLILNFKSDPKFKIFINKYFLPYNFISKQNLKLDFLENELNRYQNIFEVVKPYEFDEITKKNLSPLVFEQTNNEIDLKDIDKKLKIYNPSKNIIFAGISNLFPGSAYIDIYNDKIFLASSIGIIGMSNLNQDRFNFVQIQSNIHQFINGEQFKKKNWFSIKDLKIIDGNIYLSYTKEVKADCWTVSVIYGKLDNIFINFENFFSNDECVHSLNNEDKEFVAHQSGGRIINFGDSILLSTGEFRSRFLAQNDSSIFGKILKINKKTKEFQIISKGHRNIQGLYFDNKQNFVLSTEHGPMGGDEINLLLLNKNDFPNYGWPISSYGEHYTGKKDLKKYKKYPLNKSHSDHGFIEPIKYFSPSIGISEIIGINKDRNYIVSSLKEKSIYLIVLNDRNIITKITKQYIGERIRDIIYYNNKIYLYLEDTASIGIIN